jgi:Spy/CpxP family protein refolding chaperone
MKRFIGITGALLLAGLIAFPMSASSQGTGTGKHTGVMRGTEKGGVQGRTSVDTAAKLTAEQQEKLNTVQQKFRDDNADALKQLMTKRFDLNNILDSDKPDAEKARAIQKEISDINSKLAQKRIDLYIEMRKINPAMKFGKGSGKGSGMMGMGTGNDI